MARESTSSIAAASPRPSLASVYSEAGRAGEGSLDSRPAAGKDRAGEGEGCV